MNLIKYNRHWENGFKYPFPNARSIFSKLVDKIPQKQIVEIAGLRRTGKTTLLFQLINHCIQSGQNPFSLWYFTFDEEQPHLDDLLSAFATQTQTDFKNEYIIVFLDEIQKLQNFQNQIKIYYDLYPNIKFFISGSTSLFIKQKSQESLAGRIVSLFLMPLNFLEYLRFRQKEIIIEKPLMHKNEIERFFQELLTSQIIACIQMDNHQAKKEYLVGILKKVVFEDIPSVFSIQNPSVLWQIIRIIAQKPGLIIDYRQMGNDLGVSNKTMSNYLFYLEESFLLKKVYNFSKNLITSEKKMKRFYLASPSFSWALTDFIDVGALVENYVISIKDYTFFWRDVYQHEVDFIQVKNQQTIVPIEVKFKNKINIKELNNLSLFSKKYNCSEAIILTKNIQENVLPYNTYIPIIERPVFFI